MSPEDLFVLTKLFEIDGLIDYRAILDEKLGNGIVQHITPLPIKEIRSPLNEPLQLHDPK
jgi:hypothetical protein